MTEAEASRRILGFICFLLLFGLLCAGLRPFHSPTNDVSWVANANAVRFGRHGTILGQGFFSAVGSRSGGRTLEIWLQPGLVNDSDTFIAFYDPGEPRHLSLHQSGSDLELRIAPVGAWRREKTERLYVDSAFRGRRSTFWTVTSGLRGTAIYRDGLKLRESSEVRVSAQAFSGRLVIGNSPIFNDSWSGILRGIAIYEQVLDPTQISRHYQTWTKGTKPDLISEDACIALYLFDEHSGNVVHNRVDSGYDLYIPAKYRVVDQIVMDPVWRAFNWSWGFWKDAVINVCGFIPVGCFFCAYLSARGFDRPTLIASSLGAVVSLFVELTQSHLPTRDSSMSDLLTNIAGSIIGASLYRGRVAKLIDGCVASMIACGPR